MAETKRQKYEALKIQLKLEQSSFITHWRDLGDYILPRRLRFQTSDANKGDRRNQKIIDSTATLAARTMRAGMMGGITSPARPWFRLSTPDPAMAESGAVKEWLHIVSQRMTTVFLKSNVYNVLPTLYGDMGVFGTGAIFVEEDFEEVIRCYSLPIGSFMVSTNEKNVVDTFFREFRFTVRQIVSKFGRKTEDGKIDWSNISDRVKELYERGQFEDWIDVCHVIRPNEDYNPKRLEAKFKKYVSCYYEAAGGTGVSSDDKYLRESGYDHFPVLCPRWEVTGEDAYGTSCPGMDSLGDTKQLQHGERRAMQAIDKMVTPPMTAPPSLKGQRTSVLPGDVTYVDESNGKSGFRPAHEVNVRINELEMKQDAIRHRIRRAFYEDLFLMLSTMEDHQRTATEIAERKEEKLLALGPVLEQLNQDLLDPLIEITFNYMVAQSVDANGKFMEGAMIPPPPEELKGLVLKIEYISVMAQAQKLVGIGGMERVAQFAGQLVGYSQELVDKIDFDQLLDEYSEAVGISPRVIRSDEAVAEIRQGRAQAQAQQAKAQMMQQAAGAAKDLSQTSLEGDSALNRLMQQAQAGQVVPQ